MLTEPTLPQIPDSLRKLYPFRTRTFAFDGQKISFVDEGAASAPALVLLHGNPTWSFLYRKSISKLAERFRVIAPDHVGFGLSDKPTDPGYHTLERHVANVTALIDALKLEKVTFALHDWGGPIGLGYAAAHPGNVSRILLMNTWGDPPPPGTEFKLPLALRILRSSLGEWLVRNFNVMVKRGIPSASARPIPAEVMAGYVLPFAEPSSRTAMTAFERMIPLKPGDAAYAKLAEIRDGLNGIHARVEILWGARDPVFRTKLPAYMLRDRFPNSAEPVFLENASHFVPEDAPEQITDKLLEIFKPKPVKPQQTFNILP
jgi:haloalkane dehalogenase